MESLPLIPKSKIVPNLDVTSVIREIFQTEFEAYVPSKKFSENLRKSLEYERLKEEFDGEESIRSVCFLENLPREKRKLMEYAEKVFEAYEAHEEALNKITKVELNVMETQAVYLQRQEMLRGNDFLCDLLKLKRRPLMKPYNPAYVKEYKLLQGDSTLPPKHEAGLDFRMKDYQEWKEKLSKSGENVLSINGKVCNQISKKIPRISEPIRNRRVRPKKAKSKEGKPNLEIFRAEPKLICFTEYEPGYTYECYVTIRNVHIKPMKFSLRPLPPNSPFKVELSGTNTSRILPGLNFKLLVRFEPVNLEDKNENLTILIEDGTSLVIPIICYMEPPILKTHEEMDESNQNIQERIQSSYINCGACFPGDSKITKIRFCSFGGAGEFFLMTDENWSNWHIDCLTCDNFTDLPPFRLYPTYFKLEKNQVIDLFVEFKPTLSGLHSDNIMIVCSNGEVRNLDILGDGISWNKSFIDFEKNLEKDFPVCIYGDHKAMYHIDLGSTYASGKIERMFSVSNNSIMPFEFRWEMRDAVIPFRGQEEEPEKLVRSEVRIQPSSGTFDPCTTRTFLVTVRFNRNRVACYRTVLSLYIIGLPYQSIEQASTIIRPSVLRHRFKSGSVCGEEDNNLLLSPEFSYQGTYESVQEGMKSEGKYQQFPEKFCQKCPGICCIPLRKSKTFSHISDDVDASICSETRSPEIMDPMRSFNDCFQKKPNITDLGSDLLWDFVDVLVDELELWAEVVPTVVTLEPYIVNVDGNVGAKTSPAQFDVYVHNNNDFPVKCKWVKSTRQKFGSEEDSKEGGLSTLYHMNGLPKREESETEEYLDEDWDRHSGVSVTSLGSTNYQVTCYATQQYGRTKPDASANNHVEITVEPKGLFTVPPQSRKQCTLSVSATEPGVVNKVLTLSITDDEPLQLHVVGKIPDPKISVYPHVLDFGIQRSGSRPTKHFKIKNESNLPVDWKIEYYKFNHAIGVLTGPEEEKSSEGTLEENGYTIKSYKLDTRTLGMHTYILKFDLLNPSFSCSQSKYIVVLAYVQDAKLAIEAPRFGMAILAPSRTMFVGKMINQTITLRNMRKVATKFIWGNPFGCHCRKLNITMSPKICSVGALKTLNVNIAITPLEEGIIDHCYVPCFFSRRMNPVILSIVGVVRNIQVTFEMKKENPCNTSEVEVLKISWPIKNFDPCIGLSYIPEHDILTLACHCDEIEEYLNKTTVKIDDLEDVNLVDENPDKVCRDVGEEGGKQKEEDLMVVKNEIKGIKMDFEEEGPGLEEDTMRETESGITAVVEYPKRECADLLFYAASELQFFNTLYKTVAVKDFVIRNESPLARKFSLSVRYFGKSENCVKRNKIQDIKRKVFGPEKNEFEENIMPGQPLLITTSPEEGILKGWEAIKVNVFVYGNTWGEYRDFITCDICGMPPFVMKILVQLSGHPITFPMFAPLPGIPVVRFNTVKYKAEPVVRSIKVRNVSSIPITVTWMVFLTLPISEETKEEPFNLCLDFYTDKESEDPEKTTKSSCNYISKNASGSFNFLDRSDFDKSGSNCTGMSWMSSSKKESCKSEFMAKTIADSTRPEIQLLENFGKIDLHLFQITPRELDLEPHSQEKINITFDPGRKQQGKVEEYEAVVTGCVRLRQEHAYYQDIYQRPCGKDYVTKLLQISASVEKPLLQFDILKSDLWFIVNSNDVIKAEGYKIMKKYLLRNRCQTPINALVRLLPGRLFSIKRIETLEKYYEKFDRPISIEPGRSIQVHLELSVKRNQVADIYRRFRLKKGSKPTRGKSSEMIIEGEVVADYSEGYGEQGGSEKDFDTESPSSTYSDYKVGGSEKAKVGIRAIDSALVHGLKAKEQKSWNSAEDDVTPWFKENLMEEELYEEYCGECLEIRPMKESVPDPEKEELKMSYTVREELVFEQVGLLKQKLTLAVEMFFPVFKIDPDEIDFGNVHIGETTRRYTSVINLTQFAFELGVDWSGERNGFSVYPSPARVPASNYKPSTGAQLVIEFTPKEPGHARKVFRIYGNKDMVFEFYLLTVSGVGVWDEKYKKPETAFKFPSIFLPY